MAPALFAAAAAGGAVVYKWTDSAGVVHFSDQPAPGAEKIITSSGTLNGIGGQAPASNAAPIPNGKPPAGGLKYSDMTIDSPAREQVFFGDESVSVHLHLTPGLQQNHTVTWRLNGQELDGQAGAVAFTLQPMPRGTYAIAATVSDPVSGESRSADSVTFYIRQPSIHSPEHK